MKRYFVISYTLFCKDKTNYGCLCFTTFNEYVKYSCIKFELSKVFVDISNIVVNNIIELNELDYKDFNS